MRRRPHPLRPARARGASLEAGREAGREGGREVAREGERRAREWGLSLNRTVARLLANALGLDGGSGPGPDRDELDALAGSWSEEEADEFDATLAGIRRIDAELWE